MINDLSEPYLALRTCSMLKSENPPLKNVQHILVVAFLYCNVLNHSASEYEVYEMICFRGVQSVMTKFNRFW